LSVQVQKSLDNLGDLNNRGFGAIIIGKAPGRLNNAEITLCDLTGTGAQDTAIANHVLAILKP
jgi:ornithine cyclodeaminase/alanine dehydrogenase-like protein (mu-crystallin family)